MTLIKDTLAVMAGSTVGALVVAAAVRHEFMSATDKMYLAAGMGYGYAVGMSGDLTPKIPLILAGVAVAYGTIEIDERTPSLNLSLSATDVTSDDELIKFLAINAGTSMAIPFIAKML